MPLARPGGEKSALDGSRTTGCGLEFQARGILNLHTDSHYVITDGGDQPECCSFKSQCLVLFPRKEFNPDIMAMYTAGINIAKGAALMTDTKMSYQILGTAWPTHMNKALAENMYAI
jgi:aminobenzoyl-glutamate utilization protein B